MGDNNRIESLQTLRDWRRQGQLLQEEQRAVHESAMKNLYREINRKRLLTKCDWAIAENVPRSKGWFIFHAKGSDTVRDLIAAVLEGARICNLFARGGHLVLEFKSLKEARVWSLEHDCPLPLQGAVADRIAELERQRAELQKDQGLLLQALHEELPDVVPGSHCNVV